MNFKVEEKEVDSRVSDFGNLMILGNGFDLNLGYPTSYEHFFKNVNDMEHGGFPFVRGGRDYHGLGRYVLNASIHGWYDLEDLLAQYGSRGVYNNDENPQKDQLDYIKLVNSLALYLKSLDLSHPDTESVAARVFIGLSNCFIPFTVYSFNYTDINTVSTALGLSLGSVAFVHGSLESDDIILGVGDYGKLTKAYDYMYKTSNPKYKSTNLFHELDACNNLLIFGLSLSQVDYPYFEGFFKKVASGAFGTERKKFIRIFTFDEASRMEILRNLRKMNQGMISLYNNADFDIIRTKDNMDEHKVAALIDKIKNEWTVAV